MFSYNKYPYTNFHELNLDWVMEKVKENENAVEELTKTVNSLPGVDSALPPSPYANIEDYITEEGGRNDVTYAIAKMLNEGKRYIFLPPGTYRFNWPENSGEFHLKGSGSTKTTIRPANTDPLFRFTGSIDNSSIEGVHAFNIQEGWAVTDGIRIESGATWNFASMKDVVFENFRYGFINYGRIIWGLFEHCGFIGCSNSGFESHTRIGAPLNNNTFVSCRFNNNRNRGLAIFSDDVDGAIGNSFYGCNIESNLLPSNSFGNPTEKEAVILDNNNGTLFSGTYFEANTNHGFGDVAVRATNGSKVNFGSCTFTIENTGLIWGAGNSIITMVGCTGHSNGRFGPADTTGSFFVKSINSYLDTTSAVPFYVQKYLDFRFGDTIYFEESSADLVFPANRPDPVYIIPMQDATVYGAITESGANVTLNKGKTYVATIKNGKLSIG